MKLSIQARVTLVVLMLVTFQAHLHMVSVGFDRQVGNSKAAGFLADTLVSSPKIIVSLAGQTLFAFVLYGSFFYVIASLGRCRREPRHWAERDWLQITFAWLAISWLTLRWHSAIFPHSVWVWLTDLVFETTAAPALDVLLAGFLSWRLFDVVACGFRALYKRHWHAVLSPRAWAALALIAPLLAAGFALRSYRVEVGAKTEDRRAGNVIVIGLDSLRRDVLLSAQADELPNLYALREKSFLNANVVTPQARTFPSWVTILTGQHPIESGARENHAPQNQVKRDASFAWDFNRAGFRTIYATDETRFSHILPEYGFDEVIGPEKGVADFLLGQFGDHPLVNFAIQLPYAEFFLPALTGNRAFAHAYNTDSFIGRLERSIGSASKDPTLLALHLCTAHWPYHVASATPVYDSDRRLDGPYWSMVRELDRQLGRALEMLRARGYLDDRTMIVVLADHGEGLKIDREITANVVSHGIEVEWDGTPAGGHGSTLLDPKQWEVFVMFSGATAHRLIEPGRSDSLASLEDVAQAIRELALSESSSAALDRYDAPLGSLARRQYVLMETGWRPRGFNLEKPNGDSALRIAESSYRVLPDGRVELKEEAFNAAIADKDIGVTDGRQSLLAMVRDQQGYLVVNDHDRKQWDVYPAFPESTPPESLPLLNFACAYPEFRLRVGRWCAGA